MPFDLEIIFRLVLASFFGGLIGLEREVHGREAGIRTYLLVSLGSALVMIVAEYLAFEYQGKFSSDIFRADPGRIAAQAVTGIGFLGAGVIIRYKNSIRGLTTAASMWVVCAVGLAIGSGFYLFGSAVSGIAVLSLVGLKGIEKRLSKDWYEEMIIVSEDSEGQTDRIQEVMDRYNIKVTKLSIKKDFQKKEITLGFRLRLRAVQPDRNILKGVFGVPGIKRVDLQ